MVALMDKQELAQQILELIERARHDGHEAHSETFEMDCLLGALDEIEALCKSVMEQQA